MTEKIEDIEKEIGEEKSAEYYDFIKSAVKDGSYFKDAVNWYFLRYVNPFCERTVLIFSALISLVVLFCLVEIIQNIFPLVEETPVVVRAKDQSQYFPNLVSLRAKKEKNLITVDESVAKYLLSRYIADREGYDYSKAEISDINKKFAHIKNTSSVAEYRKFQLFMSKDNPASPIYYFGLNVKKEIKIESVKFIKKEQVDFAAKARNFLQNKLPTEAQVRFESVTIKMEEDVVKRESEKFMANIGFTFSGANKDEKNKSLNFVVNSYKLYKVGK